MRNTPTQAFIASSLLGILLCAVPFAARAQVVVSIANAASTGTTNGLLAKLTGAPSTAVKTATTDTSGIIGVVVSGGGTTGNALIARSGQVNCTFDGATTAGDYVINSGSTAGDCSDAGATYPGGNQVLGQVLTTNGGGGSYAMTINPEGLGLSTPLSIGWLATINPNGSTIAVINRPSTINAIVGDVETATGGTATVSVYKAPSGTACSAGTVLHSGSFNANGTAATNQTLTVTVTTLAVGDRLCLQTTGTTTWTSGTGVGGITVFVSPS